MRDIDITTITPANAFTMTKLRDMYMRRARLQRSNHRSVTGHPICEQHQPRMLENMRLSVGAARMLNHAIIQARRREQEEAA